MAPKGLDYLSGNVPGGVWLPAAFIIITWFVLWFVYNYSGILRLKRLWIIGTIFTICWCLGYAYIWSQYPPPQERNRVLILPGSPPQLTGSFLDLYLSEIHLYESLKIKTQRNEFLIYHPDWPLSIAHWDSLGFSSYQAKLIDFMRADYVFLFNPLNSEGSIVANLLIRNRAAGLDTIRRAVVRSSDQTLNLCREALEAFSADLDEARIYTSKWPKEVQEAWAGGKIAYILGDVSPARNRFREALQKQRDFYPARLELAQLQIDSALIIRGEGGQYQHHLAEALQHLNQIQELGIIEPKAARIAGEYSILAQNFVIAEAKLKESYYLEPDNDRLYLDFTKLHSSRYQDLKFIDEEALYRQALFVNPASVEARIQYSDYLQLKSRLEESRQVLLEIFQISAQNYDALMALGKLYLTQRRDEEAFSIYSDMLQMNHHSDTAVKFNLGVTYYHRGDVQTARQMFEELSEMNPDAFLYLAYIGEKAGDLELAIDYLRKRIRHNRGPNDPFKEEARRHLVRLLQMQKEAVN